jgi:S-formylglutathione hydrolase FrmB
MQQAAARRSAGTAQGTVRTDTLWAQSLGIRKALTVYLPPSYGKSPSRRYPVLVYLHGYSGNERNWVEQGALARTLDSLAAAGKPEAIVVMPDGDDGWYTTWNQLLDASVCRADTVRREPAASYCVPWPHYDDYIANDIVKHVDARYRTRPGPASRGIAGLSMGGYGAITLALAYPHVFGAAASHSGVLSPRFLGPKPWAAPPRYATTAEALRTSMGSLYRALVPAFGRDTIGWVARDPGRMAARLKRRNIAVPALLLDCGTDDPFIDQNRDLHHTLQRLGIAHRFTEWPGKHDWAYWRSHSRESLTFLLERVAR